MDSSSWNRSMESPPSPTSLRSIPSHDPIRLGQGASSSTHRAIPDGLDGISSLSIHLNSSTAPLPSPPTSAPISTLRPIPPTPNSSRAILAQTPSTGARLAHSPLGDGSIGDHTQEMRSRAVNIANVAVGQGTMCSPPTPAPSPTPRGTWTGYPRNGTLHQHVSEDEESMDHPELLDHLRGSLGRPVDIGKGKGRAVPGMLQSGSCRRSQSGQSACWPPDRSILYILQSHHLPHLILPPFSAPLLSIESPLGGRTTSSIHQIAGVAQIPSSPIELGHTPVVVISC